jgi:hypothetical protein
MTKSELIAQFRQEHPTLKVGSNETGYTTLNNAEYEQTLSEWADATLKINAVAYKEKRQSEYPPIHDYIDGIVKGDQTQVQAYIDACLAVKAKHPKP